MPSSTEPRTPAELQRSGLRYVLDVRRDDEWSDGHVAVATYLPMHDLLARLEELPAAQPLHPPLTSMALRAASAASMIRHLRITNDGLTPT